MRRICLAVIIAIAATTVKAQPQFRRIDNTDGLSNNTVLTILQDKRGFIWIGTDDGLNRYDGYAFKIYKPDFKNQSGISHNIAKVLFEDHAGNIWIGTDGGGLNKFDPITEKFTQYLFRKGDSSGLNHNNVTAIVEERDKYLWVGTYGGGLNRLDLKKGTFEHYINKEGDSNTVGSFFINCLTLDANENLWIGTWGRGLDKLDLRTMSFTHYQHNDGDPATISDNTVNSIFFDGQRNLWIGTWEGGLNLLQPHRKSFIHFSRKEGNFPANNVRAITADLKGDLWIASFGEGVTCFDHRNNVIHHFKHDDNNSKSIGTDNLWTINFAANMLWVGSIEGGLYTIDFSRKKFVNLKSLSGNDEGTDVIDALCETPDGNIWTGTFGKGLVLLDRNLHTKKTTPPPLMSTKVTSILSTTNGDVWITTDAGVTKYDPKTNRSKNYVIAGKSPGLSFSNTKIVYEDHDGEIWIGTWGGGLNRYNPANDSFTFYFPPADKNENGLADGNIWSILMDDDDILWIGTNDGLSRFDKRRGRFFTYRHSEDSASLSDNHVTSIYVDREHRVWVGTLGGGINLFDKQSETFTSFTEREGLANNLVKSMLEDNQDNLWIATNTGLSKFNYKTGTFKNYDNAGEDGNSYRIASALKRKNGEMLFGGVKGITRFNPDNISTNVTTNKVFLTDILLFGQPLHPGEKVDGEIPLDSALMFKSQVDLRYDQNMVTFRFSSPQFSENKPLFSYKLEGFDSKWFITTSNAAEHKASYTNLPPGIYVFKVKSTDEDGEPGGANVTSLKIVIKPPFWETIYFKAFLVTVMTLLLYIAYRIITIKKEEKHRQATLLANQKIKELENDNLQQEIDYKNRELANISMNLVEKTKFLTEQIRRLESIANISDREIKVRLNHLIENFNKEITTEKDWEYFELHFDKVHQNFIANLKTTFPELSATDIRLAALIRMNLSNKEIAELMNKSVRSIESSRYRLRKSLNLSQGDNLTDYLFRL